MGKLYMVGLLVYVICVCGHFSYTVTKGNNKITGLRTIFQRESQNS
jgi:hypothetical protein